MFNFKQRPYHLFLISAILLALFSVTIGGDDLDINLHDSYFVIKHSFIPLAALFVIFWCTYYFFNRMFPSRILTFMHVWGTFLPMFLIVILPTFEFIFTPDSYSFSSFNRPAFTIYFFILFLVFSIGQISLLINLAKGVVKSHRTDIVC